MLVSMRKIPVKRKKTAPNSIFTKTTCKQSQTKHLTPMIAQSIVVHCTLSSASSSVSLSCSELSSEASLCCRLLFLVVSLFLIGCRVNTFHTAFFLASLSASASFLFLYSSSLDLVSDIEKDF